MVKKSVKHPEPRGPMDLDWYESLDGEWRKIGVSAITRRALIDAKLYRVSDLRRVTEAELKSLKGVSKSSMARIKQIMEAKRISFRL